LPADQRLVRVDIEISIQELQTRCPECASRINDYYSGSSS
jgi:hypothetical protein